MKSTFRLLTAIGLTATGLAAPAALAKDTAPLVPDCSAATSAPGYAQSICANPAWIEKVNAIKTHGDALAAELPDAWKSAFEAHQAAFPQFITNCPTENAARASCIETALDQRLADIAGLAASDHTDAPACTASEVTITDSGIGDAGMSKSTEAYFIAYTGTASCRLLGYPAITVTDSNAAVQWTVPVYATSGNYFTFAGPPLPVTLTAANPKAWFAISVSSGCDPASGTPGYTVAVAPPLSTDAITALSFESATCPAVTVSPIGMRSMLEPSIN